MHLVASLRALMPHRRPLAAAEEEALVPPSTRRHLRSAPPLMSPHQGGFAASFESAAPAPAVPAVPAGGFAASFDDASGGGGFGDFSAAPAPAMPPTAPANAPAVAASSGFSASFDGGFAASFDSAFDASFDAAPPIIQQQTSGDSSNNGFGGTTSPPKLKTEFSTDFDAGSSFTPTTPGADPTAADAGGGNGSRRFSTDFAPSNDFSADFGASQSFEPIAFLRGVQRQLLRRSAVSRRLCGVV